MIGCRCIRNVTVENINFKGKTIKVAGAGSEKLLLMETRMRVSLRLGGESSYAASDNEILY